MKAAWAEDDPGNQIPCELLAREILWSRKPGSHPAPRGNAEADRARRNDAAGTGPALRALPSRSQHDDRWHEKARPRSPERPIERRRPPGRCLDHRADSAPMGSLA